MIITVVYLGMKDGKKDEGILIPTLLLVITTRNSCSLLIIWKGKWETEKLYEKELVYFRAFTHMPLFLCLCKRSDISDSALPFDFKINNIFLLKDLKGQVPKLSPLPCPQD